MSDERQSNSAAFLFERLCDSVPPVGSLKRKLGQTIPTSKQTHAYPSPPMSNPPSPPRPSPPLSTNITAEARTGTTRTPLPPYPSGQAFVSFPSSAEQVASTAAYDYAPSRLVGPALGPGDEQSSSRSVGALSSGQNVFPVTLGTVSTPALSSAAPTRTGRKAKAHVASACTNCKRAHLSCDAQRPCTRCVTSGKQDSCFDVPHKKRGRPRLREENEFKSESMMLEQPGQAPMQMTAVAGPSTARPIARTRHQRNESLRSLRSQTSDGSSGSSLPTPGYPPILQPGWVYQPPRPPSSGMSAALVPTAFLDLDFNFMRANRPFQQIVSNDRDVRGRRLEDVVTAADGENFITLRARLKGERESREPAHMPPMLQPGEDPIQGVLEDDIEKLASGFSDQTYTWSRAASTPQRETFPARVRLAKATAYFVVVTLPSFRPVEMLPPQPSASLPPPGFMIPPPRAPMLPSQPIDSRMDTQAASPRSYYPQPSPVAGMQQYPRLTGQPLHGRSYSNIQPYPAGQPFAAAPTQRPQPPTTPRLPTAEPPMQITPITPLTTAPGRPPRLAPAMQLPPLTGTPTTRAALPVAGPSGATQPALGSDDDDEESPKKRRRMDISDVLQR